MANVVIVMSRMDLLPVANGAPTKYENGYDLVQVSPTPAGGENHVSMAHCTDYNTAVHLAQAATAWLAAGNTL